MTALHDDFAGEAGSINGRIAPTGQRWLDPNDRCYLDGNGRLIANVPDGEAGHYMYAQIALDAPVTSMRADISWVGTSTEVSQNGAVTLIAGNAPARAGTPPNQGIFFQNIHAVFGIWATSINMWNGTAPEAPDPFFRIYPGGRLEPDGRIYHIGMAVIGQLLVIDLPNGERFYAADSRIPAYSGSNLIYQCYNTTAVNLRPRIEEVWAETAPVAFGTGVGVELPY